MMPLNIRRLALLAMLDATIPPPREKSMENHNELVKTFEVAAAAMAADPKDYRGNLPLYQCHKRVRAVKIGAITLYDGDDKIRIKPADSSIPDLVVSEQYHQKHQPQAGGYFVLYEDGYQSYSPAEAFETGYTLATGRTDTERLHWLRIGHSTQEFGETMDAADPQSLEAFRAVIDGMIAYEEQP